MTPTPCHFVRRYANGEWTFVVRQDGAVDPHATATDQPMTFADWADALAAEQQAGRPYRMSTLALRSVEVA